MRILIGDDLMAGRGTVSRVLGAGATILSAGQTATLKAEIAKPAYTGMSVAELCDAINLPGQVDNPVDVTQVRSSTTIALLKEWWRPLLGAVTDPAKKQKWFSLSSSYLAQYSDDYRVEYDASSFAPLRVGALADKIVTQDDLDALMPLVDDPAYVPTFWLSVSDTLFGTGTLIEASDLVGLV